jgi:hypothetical protein
MWPKTRTVAELEQMRQQLLLLTPRPRPALAKIKRRRTQQQVNKLERISRAGVNSAYARDGQPVLGAIDRVGHVTLEFDFS